MPCSPFPLRGKSFGYGPASRAWTTEGIRDLLLLPARGAPAPGKGLHGERPSPGSKACVPRRGWFAPGWITRLHIHLPAPPGQMGWWGGGGTYEEAAPSLPCCIFCLALLHAGPPGAPQRVRATPASADTLRALSEDGDLEAAEADLGKGLRGQPGTHLPGWAGAWG